MALVCARRFDAQGEPDGDAFAVSDYQSYTATPGVVMFPDGGFAVAWRGADGPFDSSPDWAILMRRYAADGQAGELLHVNGNSTLSAVSHPTRVVANAQGESLVVWRGGLSRVWARRYDANGTALGDEVLIDPLLERPDGEPRRATVAGVVLGDSGDFFVTWLYDSETFIADGGADDQVERTLYLQHFSATGTADVLVELDRLPDVWDVDELALMGGELVRDGDGNIAVLWRRGDAGPEGGVAHDVPMELTLRRFNALGEPVGDDLVIDGFDVIYEGLGGPLSPDDTPPLFSPWAMLHTPPRIAMNSDGDLVVAVEVYRPFHVVTDTGAGYDLLLRAYGADGIPLGRAFIGTACLFGRQGEVELIPVVPPSVALNDEGQFIAAWVQLDWEGDEEQGVFARYFALGAEGELGECDAYEPGNGHDGGDSGDGGEDGGGSSGSFVAFWLLFLLWYRRTLWRGGRS
ncbi:MAG: hypothetical protein C0462_08505 [Alcanivorax sp.]|nr:hypothetical protein [Alcanivorax sp.]